MADYKNEWTEQLRDLTDRIANREKFTFDVNGEALMKQYGDQYKRQGQAAMMDTMGKAQAMTGGYGNSYAQSVGQQTYQNYMQGATDKIPELYQLALSKYKAEGDEMKDLYGILTDREAFRQQEIEAQKAEDARAAARGSGGNPAPYVPPTDWESEYLTLKMNGAGARELDSYLQERIREGDLTEEQATELRNKRY